VKAINEAILPDTSFTGRTAIWKFALDNLGERPMRGFGFGAFWATPGVRYGSDDSGIEGADAQSSDARRALHAHNAYLDLALTIGVPGLALVLMWVVVLPLVDMARTSPAMLQAPFALMLFRIWFFGLLYSSLESGLLNKENPVGFMFLFVTFSLQLLSRYRPV
jgi:O-antigen ligase